VRHRDAVALIAGAAPGALAPQTWVDLGSGDGTFTLALAALLPRGSVIHAIDRDRDALARIGQHADVRIETHVGDFAADQWPVATVDGILIANALHYVEHQRDWLRQCASRLTPAGRFLIVEYDTEQANPWVPYPVSRRALTALFDGWGSVTWLGERPSAYRRASLYGAMAWITGV
jgi:trans-aconitate methyltransferase